MKKLLFILIIFSFPFFLKAQKSDDTGLFSKKVKSGRVSGYLVGIDPRNPRRYYYFKYETETELKATVSVNLRDGSVILLKRPCEITLPQHGLNAYIIKLSFTKDEIRKINNEDPLSFSFEFKLSRNPTKVVRNGIFKTDRLHRRVVDSSFVNPRSEVDFDPGFVVTAPEELSIYLIQQEVEGYLQGVVLDKSNYNKYYIGESNFIDKPSINIDSLNNLTIKMHDEKFKKSIMDSLFQITSIYHFCNNLLDTTSFFRYEGMEIKKNIDSLQNIYNKLSFNPQDSLVLKDSVNFYLNWIRQKKDALVEYEKTINRLEFVRDKTLFILKKAFLEFRD